MSIFYLFTQTLIILANRLMVLPRITTRGEQRAFISLSFSSGIGSVRSIGELPVCSMRNLLINDTLCNKLKDSTHNL